MYRWYNIVNKYIQLIICMLVVSACFDYAPAEQNYFDKGGAGDTLLSTLLLMDSTRVQMNCDCVIGDKLLLLNQRASYRYEVFTIKGDSLLYDEKFLYVGRAPYEMLSPNLRYDSKNNRLFLYSDNNLENKLFTVDIQNFNNVYDPANWKKKDLPILYSRGSLGIVNDTVFINRHNTNTANMFSLSQAGDKDNSFQCLNFKYPGEHPDLSFSGQGRLFIGDIKRNPNSLSFVYSCYFSQYVFIFDLVDEQITNLRYISQVLPVYKVDPDDVYNPIAISDEYESGYDQFRVTGNYIYIGYNNTNWGEIRNQLTFKDYPYYYFDRINVFDWDGKFVRRLVLDQPIYNFTVSSDDQYLYGSSMDLADDNMQEQVLRFELFNKK